MSLLSIESNLTPKRKRILQYFVFVAFFLPAVDMSGYATIFNALVPNPLGYKMLALILSFPLLCRPSLSNSNIRVVYKAVFIASLYQIFVFFMTANLHGIYNALTVYRHSFVQCLHFAVLIPFIIKCSKDDLCYIVNVMCKYILVLSIIYLLDSLIFHKLSIFALGQVMTETRGGVSVDRSIIGFPPIIGGWIFFFFVCMLQGSKRAKWLFFISIFVTLMSFTRSMMLETVIGIVVIVLVLLVFKSGKYVGTTVKFSFAMLSFILVLNIFNSDVLSFWENKLAETFGTELVDDSGTYNFRQRLIEDAQRAIIGNEVTGLGYVRDTEKGEYSFVLGGDTYIAPIIYCEGYLGLTLRILPYLLLFFICLNRVVRMKEIDSVDIAIIALVISSVIGYVQTKTIVCYPLTLMILCILKQFQYHTNAKDKAIAYKQ